MLPLSRLLPALALTGVVALAAPTRAQAPAQAPAPMTEAQRQAIEGVVRDYLLKNPEVLQEAMAELEKRQQESQRQAQASALKETRDTLHNSPHGLVAGNPNGDVTLVEFFDYNCGYCKRALTDLQTLVKGDPKLRIVLKDFPVLGPDSVEASKVALAAKQQLKGDRLFEYHVKLIESRGKVNGERAIAVAREMGLDIARLQKDMQSPDVQAALQENVSLGDKLGLSGTPAFIIGDEIIPGAVGAEPIRKTIAGVRQCGHATC
jgi:protein-disulfide isomerase